MNKIFFVIVLLSSSISFSWGGRGHDTICQTAVFLLKEPGLKEYLQNKPQMMGHLCNIPDTHWRSLKGDPNTYGSPAHHIDPEILGIAVKDIPLDFKKLVSDFTGKSDKTKNDGSTIKSIPAELGSSWWRADQFMRRIAALNTEFTKATAPTNSKEEQDSELAFNKLVYQMIIDMGLMGHFVGDNAQPFHTTADYDGWAVGHGGIHAYYEDSIVSEFDGDLGSLVLKSARSMKNPKFLKGTSVLEKMKSLGEESNQEIPKILKLDPVIKKSVLNTDHGMKIRTYAERKPASVAFKTMKNFVVTDMARGALLLAHFWDEAYVKAGRPKLASYKSYRFPFTPDFVMPDYFDIAKDPK